MPPSGTRSLGFRSGRDSQPPAMMCGHLTVSAMPGCEYTSASHACMPTWMLLRNIYSLMKLRSLCNCICASHPNIKFRFAEGQSTWRCV